MAVKVDRTLPLVKRSAQLGLATDTVRKWRTRFAEAGLDGLADRERPGRPKPGLELTSGERDQPGTA